jgi:hypothetical protein
MNKLVQILLVSLILYSSVFSNVLYKQDNRKRAPEYTHYYIDPNVGNDNNDGLTPDKPWQSFRQLNKLILTKGCEINITDNGNFYESLIIVADASSGSPVKVNMKKGLYNFYPMRAYKEHLYISNTNDTPYDYKKIAFCVTDSKHVEINGNGSEIMFMGKVMQTYISNSEYVEINDLSFDYNRPTVSEIKVLEVSEDYADVEVHKDSKYRLEEDKLIWFDGSWEYQPSGLWQEFDYEKDCVRRVSLNPKQMSYSHLDGRKLRINFEKNPGFSKGKTYQNRNTLRDYSANFMKNSKDIVWRNVNVYFMHGMGFVAQFCENVEYHNLQVKPREGSGRTCAAWADILHFSGCKGDIVVENCFLSAANDDAINVHGTHLRIVNVMKGKKLHLRYMHPQTYGFTPFFQGDEIELINHHTLVPYSKNRVKSIYKQTDTDYIVELEDYLPDNIGEKDVVENTSWTANLKVHKCTIKHIPTRGLLCTSRGEVSITKNKFYKTTMSAILVADDANSWYESGYVKDMDICSNEFVECGTPVIKIHPENRKFDKSKYVHSNIRVQNNIFNITNSNLLTVKSTKEFVFDNNKIQFDSSYTIKDLLKFENCDEVEIDD